MTRKRKGLTARQSGFQASSSQWPRNPIHQLPRGELYQRLRRPSFTFHVAYRGVSSREELDDFLGIWRHAP